MGQTNTELYIFVHAKQFAFLFLEIILFQTLSYRCGQLNSADYVIIRATLSPDILPLASCVATEWELN
jgi:hypothetical protein